jgi:2-amino-4-hydroxy-6-hydroxymethyldihydropteridine diphosphokinase
MTSFVYLLLGSNMGDRKSNIHLALEEIRLLGTVVTSSSMYESAAWGKEDQPTFFNRVCLLETSLAPHHLLDGILEIEKKLGRERKEKWGSRLMDVDILFYGDLVINEPSLKIPHPEIANRRFTLQPLNEIASRLVHPVLKHDVATLLKLCRDPLWVKPVNEK